MKAAVPMKKKVNWPIRILLVAGVLFLFVKVVQVNAQMAEKQELIESLKADIETAKVYNEDLAEKNESDFAGYLEKRLREKGYVFPNDQIYQFSN